MLNKLVKNKIIVILGTTASGKTSLAVKLANEFNGEIVSADSRQVYRGMDIGTGKDLAEYQIGNKKIKYHLIDIVNPTEQFNLAEYQKLANQAIAEIIANNKLPIIVGGSGLYLQAIVDGYQLPEFKVDNKLRQDLESCSVTELQEKLRGLNEAMFLKLNNSDKNNKRRLIRYLEILTLPKIKTKTVAVERAKPIDQFEFLLIGLTWPKEELQQRINQRLIDRLENQEMIREIDHLHDRGLDWKKLESFGLEYKFISWYLQEKIDYETMVEKINLASNQFAKKQLTWFKRWAKQGKTIHWLNNYQSIELLINNFLNN